MTHFLHKDSDSKKIASDLLNHLFDQNNTGKRKQDLSVFLMVEIEEKKELSEFIKKVRLLSSPFQSGKDLKRYVVYKCKDTGLVNYLSVSGGLLFKFKNPLPQEHQDVAKLVKEALLTVRKLKKMSSNQHKVQENLEALFRDADDQLRYSELVKIEKKERADFTCGIIQSAFYIVSSGTNGIGYKHYAVYKCRDTGLVKYIVVDGNTFFKMRELHTENHAFVEVAIREALDFIKRENAPKPPKEEVKACSGWEMAMASKETAHIPAKTMTYGVCPIGLSKEEHTLIMRMRNKKEKQKAIKQIRQFALTILSDWCCSSAGDYSYGSFCDYFSELLAVPKLVALNESMVFSVLKEMIGVSLSCVNDQSIIHISKNSKPFATRK